jgi:hypothetical protein
VGYGEQFDPGAANGAEGYWHWEDCMIVVLILTALFVVVPEVREPVQKFVCNVEVNGEIR